MPALPPDLYDDLLQLCEPLFRLPDERDGLLLPVLSTWPGFGHIDWSGSPRSFSSRLIYALPPAELKQVLLGLERGIGERDRIEVLCARVDGALALQAAAGADPTGRHFRETVERLSAPRYELDRRFVRLTLLLDQGPEATGTRFVTDAQRPKFDSLAELLATIDERAAVLLGRPGSGKTTLLRRLELERAWAELQAGAGDGPMPFMVSLAGYRAADPRQPPPDPAAWLAGEWGRYRPNLESFEAYFRHGKLLLLLDGLNEIPHRDRDDYRDRVEQWRAFLPGAIACGNTVVFTCRSLDYSAPLGSEAAAVRQVQVEPLSPQQIADFLGLHLAERAEAVWEALRRDEKQLDLFSTPFFLRLLVDQIGPAGELPAGRAELLTGFVRQALRREIQDHRQRLLAAGPLLSEDDRRQIIHDAWAGRTDLPVEGPLVPALETLAFRMQDGRRAGEAGQVRVAEKTARSLLAEPRAGDPAPDDVVDAGIQLNVLDKDLARREIFFFHQLFQEYFAGRALAQAPEPARLAVAWQVDEIQPALAEVRKALTVSEPLPGLPPTGWEETAVFAAALTADPARFVRDLMVANLPLAARCAAAPEAAVPPTLVADLQQALLARIADPRADLRARIAAAEALGELGDPRFERRAGPHGDYLLPPLAAVPTGTYTIGDDESQFDWEKPAHPVPVSAFEMGVFPVTNAEYRLFIQAGGYDDERWWDTAAAQAWRRGEGSNEGQKTQYRELADWVRSKSDDELRTLPNRTPEEKDALIWLKGLATDSFESWLEEIAPTGKIFDQPEYWDDSRFNDPARPVVGLTWFEARAYCAWLSAQTGKAYGLPTEAEWEAAARGPEGRAYAYGPDYNVERCNTFETHIRRTTPVGVFPGGATPAGIYDLSGNVWEWTTTAYRPYRYDSDDRREDPADADARRVVRGGSWRGDRLSARAACRSDYHPYSRSYLVGFRVVCRPPSRPL
jgi:formylglycine-generating enzyme required for sulfatase activity